MNSTERSRLEECIFTTTRPNEIRHRCVVVVDEYHAVTYKHSGHSLLTKGPEFTLYSVKNAAVQIKATVHYVSETLDFVIFKSFGFQVYPNQNPVLIPTLGEKYVQLAVNDSRNFVWKNGLLSSYRQNGYFLGTSNGVFGDSGSGIFTETDGRFMGLVVGKKTFKFANGNRDIPNYNISEVADHTSEPYIIPVNSILPHCSMEVDPAFGHGED